MTEIKYRQRLQNDTWHYWGFINGNFVSPYLNEGVEDAQKHSQKFTGLYACNKEVEGGEELYAGDIVEVVITGHLLTNYCHYSMPQPKLGDIYVVQHLQAGFMLRPIKAYVSYPDSLFPNASGNIDNYGFWNGQRALKKIGDIYSNLELLTNKE